MKKRILSILLTICMVLMLCPVTAFAANGDATELQNLLNGGGTVKLEKDYTIISALNVNCNVILDLNGHTITSLCTETAYRALYVGGGHSLTLTDSSAGKTGRLTNAGTVHTGIYVSGGSFVMAGGTIDGFLFDVEVHDSSTFTMTGGTLTGAAGGLALFMAGGAGSNFALRPTMYADGGAVDGNAYFCNCTVTKSQGAADETVFNGKVTITGCWDRKVTIRCGVFCGAVDNGGEIVGGIFYGGLIHIVDPANYDSDGKLGENAHAITFMDGETQHAIEVLDSGVVSYAPVAPTKANCTFDGWYNGDTKYIFGSAITEDLTLNAHWTANPYTITLNASGGAVEPSTLTTGDGWKLTVDLPTPIRNGYTFDGWFTAAEGGEQVTTDTVFDRNTTIYAHWKVNQYTITFDTDGGSEVASITQDYGTAITAPENPTKTGYTFNGWEPELPDTMPAEDMTITAQWTVNPYTITYDLDGGTVEGNPDSYTVETDTFTLNNPTKRGYTFTGWSGTGLTGENNMAVTIAKGSTGDRTYTAHFSQNSYTVKFDTVGGSSISDKTGVTWTDTVLSGITAPTKDGWEFTGWKCGDMTVNANTKYSDLAANDTVTSVTLVAQWKDTAAPTGEISIGTNKWNSFLNTITFGLFFKDTQTVTITATDNSGEDVTIEYMLSDKELTVDQLNSATFNAYKNAFSINHDNKYVIYAKLTDHAGNVVYLSSNGIVLDATTPVISGVENGKTYCEAQTVTVTEEYIESVTVNGTEVTLDENNQFTLSPAEGTQTIVVTDKAGNETSVTVTVNDGHTAGNDDGDCSTPVYCIYHPDTVVVAAKSHDFSGEWHNDGTGHWHICQNDGCTVAETETPHSGTDDGDCTTAVICECGYVITAANAEHSYGEWQSNGNNTHTRRCTVTGCNGYEDGNCTGGTATCTSKAICEYCKTEYGELANHSLSKTDAKDATCTEDGNTAYWTCSVCHKLFSDEDGTNETMLDAVTIKAAHKLTKTEAKDATCTEDGNTAYWTCSVCHKLFSDEKGTIETTLEAVTIKAAHKLTKTEARNATVTETGNIEYWQCQDCGDIFSDPDGKNEITLEDTVIAKLPPKIIEGTGQSVTAGEKKALSFRSNAAFSDFIRVELDGKTLDEKNYTVKEGSTVVTLKADYVATLSAGEHTIGIVSESGTATTTFTVNAKAVVDNDTKSPQTGDNSHMALWIALLFMSGAGVIGTMVYGKKKRAK